MRGNMDTGIVVNAMLHVWKSEDSLYNQLFPSTVWILGLRLRSPGWAW